MSPYVLEPVTATQGRADFGREKYVTARGESIGGRALVRNKGWCLRRVTALGAGKKKAAGRISPAAAGVGIAWVLVGDGCGDYGGDDAGGDGGENVVAVDLAPLIAAGWGAEVIGAIVFDALTAAPVLGAHVVALLPLVVADVLLMVGIGVVVRLGERYERGAADAKKDE